MKNLATLIDQLQADETAARRQIEAEEQAHHAAMLSQANATLRAYCGDCADDLLPLIYTRDDAIIHIAGRRLSCASWRLGSHELKLAPVLIRWEEQAPDRLLFTIDGDSSTYSNRTPITDLLLFMRQAYPTYQLEIEKIQRRKVEDAERKRKDLITNLCWPPNWYAHQSERIVDKCYAELVALGEQTLADAQMAAYRTARSEFASKEQARQQAVAAHEQAISAYKNACREWAATEQTRLWQSHVLWRVRYTPLRSAHHADCDANDDWIKTVVTLDHPRDIISQLIAHGVATVERVQRNGAVIADFTIVTFLDAEPMTFERPPAESYTFHRSYHAGDYTIHVPPFVLDEPAPAPVPPTAPDEAW